MGLHDAKDISLKGAEAARSCDEVFAEEYTSTLMGSGWNDVEEVLGREVRVLSREELEEKDLVVEAAVSGKDVAFLVVGDPLTATTHQEVRVRALEQDIPVEIIFGASIATAVPALTGLSWYKFGRTVTIPYTDLGQPPASPYEQAAGNLAAGLHTLILLDIRPPVYMTANEAIDYLLEISRRKEGDGEETPIHDGTTAAVVARAGSNECTVRTGTLAELRTMDFGPPLHALAIPGHMHFMEERMLALDRK